MIRLKLYSFLVFSIVVCISCKKDANTNPYVPPIGYCEGLYTTVSTDTNYIPHKKNNSWTYCNSNDDYYSSVFIDTIKNGMVYFEYIVNYGATSHNSMGCICDINKIIIDSLGNYFSIRNDYTSLPDTLKIIDVSDANGDTIFKSRISSHYVLLVDKNDFFENLPNCYHIKIVFPESNRSDEFFYKKGLGIVSYNNSKLVNAQLH